MLSNIPRGSDRFTQTAGQASLKHPVEEVFDELLSGMPCAVTLQHALCESADGHEHEVGIEFGSY